MSAELSVLSVEGDDSRETQKLIAIAGELGWTTEEVEEYLVDVQLILSDDDHPYYRLATFSKPPQYLRDKGGIE